MDTENDLHWYCLRTQVRKERLAACSIRERSGLEVFAPFHPFTRRTRTGMKRFVEAVFPGYIFVRCVIARSYRQLLAFNGVRDVVRYGSTFPAVDDAFIDELKQARDRALAVPHEPRLHVDDEVEIISGPFTSCFARVIACEDQRKRVALLLGLLGREVVVHVGTDQVLSRTEAPVASNWNAAHRGRSAAPSLRG